MAKIQKITRMKHPGVLRDFTWRADLPEFGRYNIVYGWNGSGKTTLSRLFRSLELRSVPRIGQAILAIDGVELRSQDFPSATVHVRVFNRDFVNESVFPVNGGDVPPIFVVGKDSVDKQKEANSLMGRKLARETDLTHALARLKSAERELDKHCIDRAGDIRGDLRTSGSSAYNNYDKRAYRSQAQKMMADGDAESHMIADETRKSLFNQHVATIKPRVSEIVLTLPDVKQLHESVTTIRKTTVVSIVIEKLKDDTRLGSWVGEGLKLHKEFQSQKCLFCEQEIPTERYAALEAHFSTEYDQFIQRVDLLLDQLMTYARDLDGVDVPNQAEVYEDIQASFVAAELSFRQALAKLSEFLNILILRLKEKRKEPFKSLDTEITVPGIDTDISESLNKVIQFHNEVCDNFQSTTIKARDRLAAGMVAENSGDYSDLAIAVTNARDAIAPIETDIQILTQDIERLEREIVEHRQPAEDLNNDLNNYLGHDELHLKVKNTGYVFMRNGVPADSLSEGERTALALLYFLKSLDDREFNLNEGVIVLDDPVSSLDENSIFLAFGYISQRTQDGAQLFLLTHNFTFFRQVRNWFHHLNRRNRRRPARFYMLDRVPDSETRRTEIRPLDPLLEKYESDYHFLFARVYRERSAAVGTTLVQLYDIPNVARRLLESFLAFRVPHISGGLWQKLRQSQFDQSRNTRILRLVNTHSHNDGIGVPGHDPSLLGEARSVLDDLLEFIRSEDSEHYNAMVEVVRSINESADED